MKFEDFQKYFEPFDHERYKYVLIRDYHHTLLNVFEPVNAVIEGNWARLENNYLFLRKGYAWNGPDVIRDRNDLMRASLVHDAGYQLIAGEHLPIKPWKLKFDNAFGCIAREDGLPWFLLPIVYGGVRIGGGARGKYHTEESQ